MTWTPQANGTIRSGQYVVARVHYGEGAPCRYALWFGSERIGDLHPSAKEARRAAEDHARRA